VQGLHIALDDGGPGELFKGCLSGVRAYLRKDKRSGGAIMFPWDSSCHNGGRKEATAYT